MKKILLLIIPLFLLTTNNLNGQGLSVKKFGNKLIKEDQAYGVRIPNWLINNAGKWSSIDLEEQEKEMIRELSKDIKKIRIIVASMASDQVKEDYNSLRTHLKSQYDNLIEARSEDSKLDLWIKMKNDEIKSLFFSVIDDDNSVAFFDIKTKLTMEKLKGMNFFQELEAL